MSKYMAQAPSFARGVVLSHVFAEKRGIAGSKPVESVVPGRRRRAFHADRPLLEPSSRWCQHHRPTRPATGRVTRSRLSPKGAQRGQPQGVLHVAASVPGLDAASLLALQQLVVDSLVLDAAGLRPLCQLSATARGARRGQPTALRQWRHRLVAQGDMAELTRGGPVQIVGPGDAARGRQKRGYEDPASRPVRPTVRGSSRAVVRGGQDARSKALPRRPSFSEPRCIAAHESTTIWHQRDRTRDVLVARPSVTVDNQKFVQADNPGDGDRFELAPSMEAPGQGTSHRLPIDKAYTATLRGYLGTSAPGRCSFSTRPTRPPRREARSTSSTPGSLRATFFDASPAPSGRRSRGALDRIGPQLRRTMPGAR